MKLSDIKVQLTETVDRIKEDFKHQDEAAFFEPKGEKWSAAGHYLHLIQSVKPFNVALNAPKIALWWKFGKNKMPLRSYDELVAYYKSLPVPNRTGFEPRFKEHMNKEFIESSFLKHHDLLITNLSKWSDNSIEKYVLPHPLMGKISIKEMLFFMNHHINHHHTAAKK